jgi:PKD repeat protein
MRTRQWIMIITGLALLAVIAAVSSASRNQPTLRANQDSDAAAAVTKPIAVPFASPAPQPHSYLPITLASDGNSFAPVMDIPNENSRSRFKNPAKPVCPVFPKNFAAPVRVQCGVADVACTPLNANSKSAAEIAADGSLVYKNAFAGCDVSYRCDAYKTEEFITVKDANAATIWTWELDTHGLTPRLTPANTIELCDNAGIPRLRINAPEGKDANGNRLCVRGQLSMSLSGHSISLHAKLEKCAFPVVIDPSWSSTGNMSIGRFAHSAVLTSNGNVLVSGGSSQSSDLATCEIFDPTTGVWAATGSMTDTRYRSVSIALPSGKIINVGGDPNLKSCEIYEESTGFWTSTGSFNISRAACSVTLLADGSIIAAGGGNLPNNAITSTCELYNPVSGNWTYTGNLNSARESQNAVMLASGNVLCNGGGNLATQLASAEEYDSLTGLWRNVGSMTTVRIGQLSVLLSNGNVLTVGGSTNVTNLSSSEIYDATNQIWNLTGSTSITLDGNTLTHIGHGKVLATGGLGTAYYTDCEVYDETRGDWISTSPLLRPRYNHTATRLNDGRVLVTGGYNGTVAFVEPTCEIYDPRPVALPLNFAVHTGSTKNFTISSDALTTPSYVITSSLLNGVVSGSSPNLSYTSIPPFTGTDTVTYKVIDSFGTSAVATVSIMVVNQPPIVSSSASPSVILEGQSTSFSSIASDPDGDPLTFFWNFGDGSTSTDQNPSHTYASAGIYQSTCTVTDIANASTTSNAVTIHVFRDADRPIARFTSSDLNGFVGQPLGFDASFSTDPKNNIVSYDWDFGDGSPHGSQQIISRDYAAEGTYTVTLTITDGDGLTDSTTLTMVVLPAAQAGLLNSNIKYSVSWNRGVANADSLSMSALINVGTTPITQASPLSLGVVGQTFTGTSTTKLSSPLATKTGPQVKWQIKANTSKGAPKGTYTLKCTIKHASLGQAFALAGVTGTKTTGAKIPIRLGIGGSSFESSINSQFRFGSNGAKASGGGQGPK